MTKPAWERGRALSPVEAFTAIERGDPVYFRHKWTHHGWARGWQVSMLIGAARGGHIYEAIKKEPNQ